MEAFFAILLSFLLVILAYFLVIAVLGLIGLLRLTKRLGYRWYHILTYVPFLNVSRKYQFNKQVRLLMLATAISALIRLVSNIILIPGLEILVFPVITMSFVANIFSWYLSIVLYVKIYSVFEKNSEKLNKFIYVLSCIFLFNAFYVSNKDFRETKIEVTDAELKSDRKLAFGFIIYGLIMATLIILVESSL